MTPEFRLTVEGESRNLHPILRDEIYRIVGEALRNAFHPAESGRIDVEIGYDDQQFRLRVRDDSKGIDQAVLLRQSDEGHYGLPGMRERAKLAGADLAVWSEVGAGTRGGAAPFCRDGLRREWETFLAVRIFGQKVTNGVTVFEVSVTAIVNIPSGRRVGDAYWLIRDQFPEEKSAGSITRQSARIERSNQEKPGGWL